MRRYVMRFLTAASLVLCVVTAGLWVRSYFVVDWMQRWRADPVRGGYVVDGLTSDAGWIAWQGVFSPEPWTPLKWRSAWWRAGSFGRSGGRSLYQPDLVPFLNTRALAWRIPHGALAALAALLPARVGYVAMRRRRRTRTQCAGCGYDLRATPDADGPLLDRCPECGRAT